MKTTSPSLSVDSTAARSPDRSMAGPLVMRSGAPSSAATIIAIVVLPRPGGPASSTWSGGRPRRRALVRISDSCSRTRAWPVNSVSRLGRSAVSMARSSASASGDTMSPPPWTRRASSASSAWRRVSSPVIALLPAQLAQGGPQHSSAAMAWSASLAGQPRLTRPDCT